MMSPTTNSPSPWYTVFYRRGHLLLLSIIIILVAGFSAVTTLPRLEDPRIDTRNVTVLTAYPGASAARVEALVTDVIEDELRQLHEIKEMHSTSRAGISVVHIELQPWVDNTTNEQIFAKIRDDLEDAYQQFPQGAGEPELDEKRGATSFTLLVALKPAGVSTPEDTNQLVITTRLAEELADQLRNVPGTELVRMYGELEEEISVALDPFQMAAAGLSVAEVSNVIALADAKLPAGVLRSSSQNQRLQVAHDLDGAQMIREIPLKASSQAGYLRVGDIAKVQRGWLSPPADIALHNGQRVVFVAARMQPTVRVDQWTEAATKTLDQFSLNYQGTIHSEIVFEQNSYTAARLAELTQNLMLGSLVVMLVVLLFMGWRAALIVGLSLPLCAAFSIFSLSFYNEQIHQMSIFGIIIAIGLLIDNAIVITDEIRQHLQTQGTSRIEALSRSLRHLYAPLLASTLTTILGFMPIFLLSGNIGDFIGSVAISVVMALVGSLFISLTIISGLAARFLPTGQASGAISWLRNGIAIPAATRSFANGLRYAIKRPAWGILFVSAVSISGFILASQLGTVFFPSADRDQFEVYVWLPEGTSIGRTQQATTQIDKFIRAETGVEQVSWLLGGSVPSVYYNQVMTRDNTPHFAQSVVKTDTIERAKKLITTLQQNLDDNFPEAKIVVRSFGQGPPISAPIGVKIFGPDVHELHRLGQMVRLHMADLPGVTNSIASVSLGEPELIVNVSRNDSALARLSLHDIAGQLQAALDGAVGGSVLEGSEEIPIRVRVPATDRADLMTLEALPLVSTPLNDHGAPMSLQALGDVSVVPTINGISRIDGQRVNIVEAFLLPGVTAVDTSHALHKQLTSSSFVLPDGYHIRMAGDADEQQEALGLLATYAPVLLVLMVTTLILTFSSVWLALLITAVAGLSVGLGMLSLWLSGLPIGFNPMLGAAGLIGVAINGSIVVIAAINANPRARAGDIDDMVAATMSCSRHILSTTVTTVGGFVPLLLFSEGTFWPPLAVVLAGGVGFSVLLSLVFTPLVVGIWCRHQQDVQCLASTSQQQAAHS